MKALHLVVAALLIPLSGSVPLATAETTTSPSYQTVLDELKGDAKELPQAEKDIASLINADDVEALFRVEGEALPILMKAKDYQLAEDLATYEVLARCMDAGHLTRLQEYRVRAAMKLNKPEEALQLAKGLYNVCEMGRTADAVNLLAECLFDARRDPKLVHQFREEQVRGSEPPASTTQPSIDPSKTVVASVKIDPKPYMQMIDRMKAGKGVQAGLSQDENLMRIGEANLFLLADKPNEAMPLFQKWYALCPDTELAKATESVARCMRAQDGTVGRANAWVLSLRPDQD